jgi:hypothetical protein
LLESAFDYRKHVVKHATLRKRNHCLQTTVVFSFGTTKQKGTEMESQINNAIRRARRQWEKNRQISLDLFAELVELGVDVQALEDKYLRFE